MDPAPDTQEHPDQPDQPPEPDTYYSVTTAASVACVADETIRAWFDTGEVTGKRTARGRRLINSDSLRRRLRSLGITEAALRVNRSEHVIRSWYDRGLVEGYRTPAGRRRIDRVSLDSFVNGAKGPVETK